MTLHVQRYELIVFVGYNLSTGTNRLLYNVIKYTTLSYNEVMTTARGVQFLASFPGCSRLQCFVAYSMQIQRGRSGRFDHMQLRQADRGPMKNLEAFPCTISLRAGGQSTSNAASIPSVVHRRFNTIQELCVYLR